MSVRKIVLVLLALVIAGATVQFTRAVLSNNRAAPVQAETAPQAPKGKRILVAASDLPAGTLVQPSHLRWRAWPADDGLEKTYMVEGARSADEFAGAVVRQGLRAGEPVTAGRLVKPGDRGFLAAVLTPGTRAVSVAINGVTGIGGLVFPGDRVDLILTQRVKNPDGGEGPDRRASETVLSDVRVLAMDQRTNDQKGEAKVAQIATLEVSARQAEAVALAVEIGHLSLSLRSLGTPAQDGIEMAAAESLPATVTDAVVGEGAAPLAGTAAETVTDALVGPSHTITWDSDISRALGATPVSAVKFEVNQSENAAAVVKVQVVRGRESAEVSFPQR
ncbi:Flp pilus assembly protein CpaB [Azospirillum soli]|uniref:Flp pilus assembly protein CpaB n=1 Tax=Azospirillum soli TaxID=1304799 RepID=UPI001AE195B5|nr:Flp pilus assembly protein CpaB [Azospirillum soli]MBP2311001.1 pilus assembly protein CpaB [Azospirillum soli]